MTKLLLQIVNIEYNELLNKYQFDNAEFYSTPTGNKGI